MKHATEVAHDKRALEHISDRLNMLVQATTRIEEKADDVLDRFHGHGPRPTQDTGVSKVESTGYIGYMNSLLDMIEGRLSSIEHTVDRMGSL